MEGRVEETQGLEDGECAAKCLPDMPWSLPSGTHRESPHKNLRRLALSSVFRCGWQRVREALPYPKGLVVVSGC